MIAEEIFRAFREKRILIVGDLMVDEYVFGHVERISPEAPVPVVEAREASMKLGGAANVARNLISLGCSVSVAGVVGADERGRFLRSSLESLGADVEGVLEDRSRPTTVKTRIVAGSQQLLRVDWESRDYIEGDVHSRLISVVSGRFMEFDALIISDYGKGVVTSELFDVAEKVKRSGIVVSLDPKEKNFPIYRNVTTMTPNVKETFQATGIKPESDELAEEAGKALMERFNLDFSLITRGGRGLSVIGRGFKKHIPARAKQVYDVTGAGDTVISVFTLSLCSGATPVEAAEIANVAGGIVVGKLGTASVTVEEILEHLDKHEQG